MYNEFQCSFVPQDSKNDMVKYLLRRIDRLPSDVPTIAVSDYAEQKRVLPLNTPFPGPWQNERTPYLTEIMDNMSVITPIQRTVVLKGAQIGMTAAAENCVVYWIDVVPAEILFISATDDLLTKWAMKRLEPAIDSCGCRDKIFAQSTGKGSRRTGDKVMSKEFVGGALDMASAQSAPSLRSDSKRVLIRDEIDGAPRNLKTGEGDWLEVSYVRTNAYDDRRKVLDFSTPTTIEDSSVYPEYLLGDQRKFHVPCPHCGGFQELRWAWNDSAEYGLKPVLKDGRLVDAYYQCEHCAGEIYNNDKSFMLRNGHWEPTAVSSSPYMRSYHISSLYSPVGMLSWLSIYEKYLRAKDTPDGMRSFVNLYLGEPYRETGSRPELDQVIELRGRYKSKTVPDGVLFLTAGVDIQRGSKNNPDNPARIELEICGHGKRFRSWSIDYIVLEGSTDDHGDGAWALLAELIASGGWSFKRDDGRVFQVQIALIDSGDGPNTDQVLSFTKGYRNIFPSKGRQMLKADPQKRKVDSMEAFNLKRYQAMVSGRGADYGGYVIATNYYKHHTYNNLNNTYRNLDDRERPGFCEFPEDYPASYFEMLTAEERRKDGSFHQGSKRNEALDCRVMNLCAADIYLDSMVKDLQATAKSGGASRKDIETVNHAYVLSLLERDTSKK